MAAAPPRRNVPSGSFAAAIFGFATADASTRGGGRKACLRALGDELALELGARAATQENNKGPSLWKARVSISAEN
jgi:hypothetical protein